MADAAEQREAGLDAQAEKERARAARVQEREQLLKMGQELPRKRRRKKRAGERYAAGSSSAKAQVEELVSTR